MPQSRPFEEYGRQLGQVARLWRAEIDRRLSRYGLTEARWRVLIHLSRSQQPLRQKELAESIGVQGPTLVRGLDWLEAEGLVERRSISGDRRAKTVHLTDQAQPALDRIQAVMESIRAEIFEGIDPEDVATCLNVFEHISAKLCDKHFSAGPAESQTQRGSKHD